MMPFNTLKAHTLPGLLHVDTLPENVRRILGKFPEGDAHLYIPGAQIPVLGPELVTNGDFSQGTTGWASLGDWFESSGTLAVSAATNAGVVYQICGAIQGKVYKVSYTLAVVSGSVTIRLAGSAGTTRTASGVYSEIITASTTSGDVGFNLGGAPCTATIDNISVREVLSYTDRISNFSAGNFRDTAGSDYKGTIVDQPVGRVNDAARGLGPELLTNGSFENGSNGWVVGANWTISGQSAVSSGTGGSYLTTAGLIGVAGKTYICSFDVTSQTAVGGGVSIGIGGTVGPVITSGVGRYSVVLTAVANSYVWIGARGAGTWQGTVDNISIREVIGTHAQQTATNYQPTLRRGAVNLLTNSNPTWSAIAGATGTASITTGFTDPYGGSTAQRVTLAGNSDYAIAQCAIPAQAAGTYTGALMVKSATGAAQQVRMWTDVSTPITVDVTTEWTIVAATQTTASATPYFKMLGTTDIYVARVGLFAGSYTASQLAGLGGIPQTSGSAASTDAGLYSWEFDGSADYLQLDKVPFGIADNFCVVAGIKPSVLGANSIFAQANQADGSTNLLADINGANPRLFIRDSAGTSKSSQSTFSVVVGMACVLSYKQASLDVTCRANGGAWSDPGRATLNASECTIASIGARPLTTPDRFFKGSIYPVIAIKGTVSDADLLTLEKWVGKMSGVSIG